MTEQIGPWKKLSSKIVHINPWFQVRQDKVIRPDGSPGEYNIVVSKPAVFIIAVDDDKNIYFVGQHRYTTDSYSIELPAGSTDGEDVLEAAKRELKEETGLTALDWKKLGSFYSANGLLNELSYVYIAENLKQTNKHHQSDDGIDQLLKIPYAEVEEMIKSGKLKDGQSIAALMLFKTKSGISTI